MKVDGNIITAKKGKTLRRIADGFIPGNSISLGKTYYLGGKLLSEPLDEIPEHYEEIDEVIIDEENPILGTEEDVIVEVETEMSIEPVESDSTVEPAPEEKVVRQISVGDILSLEEKVEKIIGVLSATQKKKLGL